WGGDGPSAAAVALEDKDEPQCHPGLWFDIALIPRYDEVILSPSLAFEFTNALRFPQLLCFILGFPTIIM
ncbi:hypothetical protein B296_00020161, partial [Ensete ventricosum]